MRSNKARGRERRRVGWLRPIGRVGPGSEHGVPDARCEERKSEVRVGQGGEPKQIPIREERLKVGAAVSGQDRDIVCVQKVAVRVHRVRGRGRQGVVLCFVFFFWFFFFFFVFLFFSF